MKLTTLLAVPFILSSLSIQAAEWAVDNNASQVSFISTKKQNISEVHHFNTIQGDLSETGKFELDITLSSVETGIDIRNSRMQEFLFNVASYPTAVLTAQLATDQLELVVGDSVHMTIPAQLALHGVSKTVDLSVLVSKLADNKLLVVSAQPVIINAADYALNDGVEKLRELAGLPSISYAVPVSFYLTLNAK